MPNDTEDLFVLDDETPVLRPCAVLFIDILGVTEMAVGPNADEDLVALRRALDRPFGDFLGDDSPWSSAFFSDTLVLVSPLSNHEFPGDAVFDFALQASWIQVNLAAAGFFLRGGLTVGDAHLREGLLFGAAVVEAYELERRAAITPRIILSESAVAALESALEHRGETDSPFVRREADATVFVDYLDILVDDPEELEPNMTRLRDVVRAKLLEYQADNRLWEKYRWVAEYHDAYCRERLPLADHFLVDASGHARGFESFTRAPDSK